MGLLPPGDEYYQLVTDLGPSNPMQVRVKAMAKICALSPADLIGSEHWTKIRDNLL